MKKIEKQSIPVFVDDQSNPIAGVFFIGRERVLCKIEKMTEEEIISLYERKDIKVST